MGGSSEDIVKWLESVQILKVKLIEFTNQLHVGSELKKMILQSEQPEGIRIAIYGDGGDDWEQWFSWGRSISFRGGGKKKNSEQLLDFWLSSWVEGGAISLGKKDDRFKIAQSNLLALRDEEPRP